MIISLENNPQIRLVTSNDIMDVLEIYKPFVTSTAITLEYDDAGLEDFLKKIDNITSEYPFLVCEAGNKIIGYTYANKYRFPKGHQWSAEISIYISSGYHGKGIAKILYETLFSILKLQNFINVFAGIVLPNIKSEEFHKKLNFQEAGIFKNGGYKLGNWHDVKWFQLNLSEHTYNPPLPKTIHQIIHTPEFETILKEANEYLVR